MKHKILTNTDISFRVRITQAVACISHYTGTRSPLPKIPKELSKRVLADAIDECTRLGLLKEMDGSYVPTAQGREFAESADQEEFATHVRRLFESDEKLRFAWSAVSDIGDVFKKQDVTNLFLRIARSSSHPFKKTTASQYSYHFLEWARAARVCGSESFGQFRVKVRFDAPYSIPEPSNRKRVGGSHRMDTAHQLPSQPPPSSLSTHRR